MSYLRVGRKFYTYKLYSKYKSQRLKKNNNNSSKLSYKHITYMTSIKLEKEV